MCSAAILKINHKEKFIHKNILKQRLQNLLYIDNNYNTWIISIIDCREKRIGSNAYQVVLGLLKE